MKEVFLPETLPTDLWPWSPECGCFMHNSDEIFKDLLTRIKALGVLLEIWHFYFQQESCGKNISYGKN